MTLISFKALHYFCVTAQYQSIKQAAEMLAVTPGAVSLQIKALEDWLNLSLFTRQVRQLTLTDAGNILYRRCSPLLAEISSITSSMRQRPHPSAVKLSLPPAFAMLRFAPAMAEFQASHPQIDLHIQASSILSSIESAEHDLAIRYLPQADNRLDTTLLQRPQIQMVCSPTYLEQHPGLKEKDISGCDMIQDYLYQDWERIIQLAGLSGKARGHLSFDQAALSSQAAESHLGLWLTDNVLSNNQLSKGSLVPLFNFTQPAQRQLYLVNQLDLALSEPASIVKTWLIRKFGSTNETTD